LRNPAATNFRGSRGEAIFLVKVMDFCGHSLPYFDAHFMGDKFPVFDYIVNVVEAENISAIFFAQVKTSSSKYETRADGKSYLSVSLSREDLNAMYDYPGLAYLIGIDDVLNKAYLMAVDSPAQHGFSAMPTSHELDCVTLLQLRDEVVSYWKQGNVPFKSRFSR
jgi:hypothetical protein